MHALDADEDRGAEVQQPSSSIGGKGDEIVTLLLFYTLIHDSWQELSLCVFNSQQGRL
jgi:hypothetical protein